MGDIELEDLRLGAIVSALFIAMVGISHYFDNRTLSDFHSFEAKMKAEQCVIIDKCYETGQRYPTYAVYMCGGDFETWGEQQINKGS